MADSKSKPTLRKAASKGGMSILANPLGAAVAFGVCVAVIATLWPMLGIIAADATTTAASFAIKAGIIAATIALLGPLLGLFNMRVGFVRRTETVRRREWLAIIAGILGLVTLVVMHHHGYPGILATWHWITYIIVLVTMIVIARRGPLAPEA